MKPELIVIAGHNGSGKSTFALEYLKENKLPFLNPDEIEKQISIDRKGNFRILAGRKYFELIANITEKKESFIIETTLSGKTLYGFLKTLQKDYIIKIIYIFLDNSEMAIDRIRLRVLKGGHNIDDNDVIRRYDRSKSNFWNQYKEIANEWEIYYNGNEDFIQVAIGSKKEFIVLDEKLFSLFTGEVKL